MILRHVLGPVLLGILFYGCQNEEVVTTGQSDTMLELLPESITNVLFENTIFESSGVNIGSYDYLYNGGGVAIGDINNDGLPDLFFTGNSVGNALYLNKGNFEFEDITEASGITGNLWSSGVSMADVNGDGLLDIYVSNSGPIWHGSDRRNQLYMNKGNGRFVDEAVQRGVANDGYSVQSSFFDYDRDGDLDLFVATHMSMFMPKKYLIHQQLTAMAPADYNRQCNALYRNNGDGTFEDISDIAGVRKPGYGLGLAISDLNKDGWLDIYVANDFFIPDFYFVNDGKGGFKEEVKSRTGHISYFSMGCDASDINNDGWVDLGVVDMSPGDHVRNKVLMASMDVETFTKMTEEQNFQRQYMLNVVQLNRGNGYFSEIAGLLKVAKTDWSWGALFVDLDNDGWKDYFVTNGFRRDTKNNDYRAELSRLRDNNGGQLKKGQYFELMQKVDEVPLPNFVFKNFGGLKFEDVSKLWGMTAASFSNGSAYGDLDGDGDMDLVVNNIDEHAHIYRNRAIELGLGNYLQVTLTSRNSAAVLHAKVTMKIGEEIQFQEYATVRGYQSAMEPLLHFGLGQHQQVDELRVDWLDGSSTILENLPANQRVNVDKEQGSVVPNVASQPKPGFHDVTAQLIKGDFRHVENDFDDFAEEILLPHRQSTLGPCLGVGDVNGDGLEDFFIGGAVGQSGRLYLQSSDARFNPAPAQPWAAHHLCEDMGSAFLDIDNDGDLDLYVASGGGGEMVNRKRFLQDRLYVNDGTGQFKYADVLPPMLSSSGRVKPSDFDNDGDIDLFVCGRTTPGEYPSPGKSYLLRNDDGRFVDVTDEIAPGLSGIGMVTDASWEDLNSDNYRDLIVIGEWMPITIFENYGKAFELRNSSALEMTDGWWYTIEGADFDGDGDRDFIVGNLGENNKFNPTKDSPLHVYANDYDDNGTLDIVLSKEYKGNLVPLRGKECSSQQMPFVSEKFETYASFANASLDDIYTKSKLRKALHYQAFTFSSIYLENKGNFDFAVHHLPAAAQLGPINGVVIKDFDNDGNLDVVVAGAMIEAEVETPSYDANIGLLLKNVGKNKFEPTLIALESGIFLKRNVKDLALIKLGTGQSSGVIVANNNSLMQFLLYQ